MDQATMAAGFDFRRYAMKPTPAKPNSIMAQVDGSGTGDAMSNKVVLSMTKLIVGETRELPKMGAWK